MLFCRCKCRCKFLFGGNSGGNVAVMPMYMSEINVGDMSVICRKGKQLKTNMLSFYEKLVTDNKSETLSVTLSETSRTEKRFGGNENNRYYKV